MSAGTEVGPSASKIARILPTTPLARGMYLESSRAPEGHDPYLSQTVVRFRAPIDPAALRTAAAALLDRYPNTKALLRQRRNGDLVWVVPRATDPVVTVRADDDLGAALAHDRAAGFALPAGPLVRFAIVGRDLVLSYHHSLMDGWSEGLFVRDLGLAYRAATQGARIFADLDPAPAFDRYLEWTALRDTASAATAWRGHLDGLARPTLVAPGTDAAGGTPVRVDVDLPPDRAAVIVERTRALGVTLNVAMQLAWAVVLADLTGEDDVVFGMVASIRPHDLAGADRIVGLLLNTVPVRVRLDGAPTPRAVCARVQGAHLDLDDHRHLGLGEITRAAGVDRLFDSAVVFQNHPNPAEVGSVIEDVDVLGSPTSFPLALVAGADPDPWAFVAYRTGAIAPDAAAFAARRVVDVLTRLAAAPDAPLGPVRGDVRTHRGPTTVAPPLEHAFRHRFGADERDVALVVEGRTVSRGDLARRVADAARALRAVGAGPERRVAVVLPRGLDMVVTVLAVLEVGAVLVPVDPAYPDERIAFLLRDSEPHVVVACGGAALALPTAGGRPAVVDPATWTPCGRSAAAPAVFASEYDDRLPAYLVYTSGSTGTPKGVTGTRAALAGRLAWGVARWGSPSTRLAKSSLGFVDGTTELLTGILAGQCVVVADDTAARDALALGELIRRHDVEQVTAVGSLAAALCDGAADAVRGVRHWILSGEPLTDRIVASVRSACPHARITDSYGSSEVAGDVTTHDLGAEPPDGPDATGGEGRHGETRVGAVGTPVPDTGIRVLDDRLRPVPPGVVGEVHVVGAQLARGYHGAPAATAARFVADPAGTGERMYRTGDLGRASASGVLELVGRADRQVTIRGHRVELGEIETVARTSGHVRDVAVLALPDPTGRSRLVGFAIPNPTGRPGTAATDALVAHLRRVLPEHLVPTVWSVLESFPLTPNGKLDRRALARTEVVPEHADGAAPSTTAERALARIVADLVGVEAARIRADDDFFTLGGDSISAIALVHRAGRDGVTLTAPDVFAGRTVAAIAARARRATPVSATGAPASPVAFDPDPDERAELRRAGVDPASVLPTTALQAGIVFESTTAEPGTDEIYVIAVAFDVTGALDIDRLAASWGAVADRHPSLRMRFLTLASGRTIAAPDPEGAVTVRHVRVSTFDSAEARSAVAADRATFDVSTAPLVRLTVLSTSPVRHRVVLTVHHALVDGHSIGIVGTDLFRLYRGATMPPAPSFDDYLRLVGSRDRTVAASVWRRVLLGDDDASPVAPTLLAPAATRAGSEAREITLPSTADTSDALRARAAASGATIAELVHLAWAVVLAGATGSHDVVFGSVVSGRPADLDGADEMVGLFVETVPVRVDVAPARSVADVLARVRADTVATLEHRYPGLSGIQRIAGTGALFDTLVVVENFAEPDTSDLTVEADGFSVRVADFHTVTHYPVTVTVFPRDTIRIVVEYRPDLVDERDATILARALSAVLDGLVDPATRLVADLAVVADEPDRSAGACVPADPHAGSGVASWAVTDDVTLVDVLAARCAETPDAPAVTDRDTTVTFADLHRRTTRIARALVAAGIGPEDVVVVPAERTADTLVSILGVLTAGAAYLPVEPDAAVDRTRAIVSAARPAAVLVVDPASASSPVWDDGMPVVDASALVESDDDLRAITDAERVRSLRPDHPAYLIFTSGTTGVPKGVVVPHRGLTNLYRSHRHRIHEPAAAREGRARLTVAHAWSFAFDASWQPQLWLFGGHTVHVLPRGTLTDPGSLVDELTRVGAHFVEVVPSVLDHLRRAGLGDRVGTVGVGGEAVSGDLWDAVRRDGDVVVHNFYGPTETTVDAVHCEAGDSDVPVIGRPVDGMRAHVLDTALRPVPAGWVGELYLGGPGVVRGYRDAPGATAERFVADPFAPGGRLYRTGDLVVRTHAGLVAFRGRADDQVKIRGHRVEPAEIERHLRALPDVTDARVVLDPIAGTARLAAHVVAAPDRRVDAGDLRAALSARLPAYLVPAAYAIVDRLPLLPNGKLDRRALSPARVPERRAVPPRTTLERRLCATVSALVHVDDVGIDDDFFELGGDSILSMELSARLRALGISATARDVLTCRSVRALAALPGREPGPDDDCGVAPIGPVPVTPIVAWAAGLGGPIGTIAQAVALRLPGTVTDDAVLSAVRTLARRHPILTASFDGRMLVVPSEGDLADDTMRTVDVTGAADAAVGETVRRESADARTRLDPAAGRMVDVVTLRRADGGPSEVILTVHHLVVDGVSWRILLPDLAAALSGTDTAPRADATRHAPSARSFRRWAHAIADRATAEALRPDVERWAAIAAPATPLPVLRALDPVRDVGATTRRVDLRLGHGETAALGTAARALGGTLDQVLLGTLAASAVDWAGAAGPRADLVVDVEGHGRGAIGRGAEADDDGDGVVGWLTSVFPVRIAVPTGAVDILTAPDGPRAAGRDRRAACARTLVTAAARAVDAVPGDGLSYGILRHLDEHGRTRLGALPRPAVQFNHLGRIDLTGGAGEVFGASPFRTALDDGPGVSAPTGYPLIVDTVVHESPGEDGVVATLGATVTWADGVLVDVERLVETWWAIVRSLASPTDPATTGGPNSFRDLPTGSPDGNSRREVVQ